MMKFLLAVLFIRFVIEVVSNSKQKDNAGDEVMRFRYIRHPAEYELR